MENLFVNLGFYVKAALALFVYRWIGVRVSPAVRQWILIAISCYFLSTLSGAGGFLAFAIGYALSFAGLGYVVSRMDTGGKRLGVLAGIFAAAFVMLWFKYPFYSGYIFGRWDFIGTLSAIKWIGLSYLTFRCIDYLLYAGRKTSRNIPFSQAVSYLLFFAPYVSGPINRFASYAREQTSALPALDWATTRDCLIRMSVGVFKIIVLGRLFYYHSPLGHPFAPETVGGIELAAALVSYYLYLYLDFSGYCDIAIALARLFGLTVPENFNFPFLARNIQDFWNRWHISLSHWCRDHIFFALTRLMASRAPWLPQLAASFFGIFITFFFVGAWHGDAIHWILYGIYHGAGVALWLLYSQTLTRLAPEGYERLRANLAYRAFCTIATVSFVSAGLVLTLGMNTTSVLFGRVF